MKGRGNQLGDISPSPQPSPVKGEGENDALVKSITLQTEQQMRSTVALECLIINYNHPPIPLERVYNETFKWNIEIWNEILHTLKSFKSLKS